MPSTYEPIATTTLGSAAASFTFSSVPSTYTDLFLVYTHFSTGPTQVGLRFNGDTGSNYSATVLYGEGSAGSARTTNTTYMRTGHSTLYSNQLMECNIQNYSNSTTYKTVIARNGDTGVGAYATAGLWRNTAAITSVTVYADTTNLPSGAIITLYGIKAA